MSRYSAEYVLPLRWYNEENLADLTAYLADLAQLLDVTVVDDSSPELFERHHEAWAHLARHLRPGRWPGRNGKVRNVMTGVRAARHELIVIADDDVRYNPRTLTVGLKLLTGASLVVPQNVFTEWPWHARWDTARQLINRAFGGDYPGTVLVRRSCLIDQGYDGDVLFENLQLIRTVAAGGGRVDVVLDLYVDRHPPTARHFRAQRVRQAYDDFAQPARLVAEAALLPTLLFACRYLGGQGLAVATAASVIVAEAGRRRGADKAPFPRMASLWAPAWLAERAVCVWVAIVLRCIGGVRYSDGRIRDAAWNPSRARTGRIERRSTRE